MICNNKSSATPAPEGVDATVEMVPRVEFTLASGTRRAQSQHCRARSTKPNLRSDGSSEFSQDQGSREVTELGTLLCQGRKVNGLPGFGKFRKPRNAQSIATTIDPLRVHSMTSIRKEEKFEQASLSTYHFCVQVSETQSGLGIITLALVVPSDFLGLRIVRD